MRLAASVKHTDVLATMAEKWDAQTATLIDIAIGTALVKLGLSVVAFTAADMLDISRTHLVQRDAIELPESGQLVWRISVSPVPKPEATSPLTAPA